MAVIDARGLKKSYADVHALDGFDLTVEKGRIVGLIGPNGSGKTTALKSILGLSRLDGGTLDVLGQDPNVERDTLMKKIAYIADTGILPKWMRVRDLLDYVAAVHPRFDYAIAEAQLASTEINLDKRVRVLSKGMHVQLHLAIVLAIGAELLVLDEPTLGLDILYRQRFYDAVLNDFFTEERSILVTTHEVREIEHMLTDVVFIHQGKACLTISMDKIADRYVKLISSDRAIAQHSELGSPLFSRRTLAGTESIFLGVDRAKLEHLGEVATPNLAELFVAVVEGHRG